MIKAPSRAILPYQTSRHDDQIIGITERIDVCPLMASSQGAMTEYYE